MATGALRSNSLPLGLVSSIPISSKLTNSPLLTCLPAGLCSFPNSRTLRSLKQQAGGADRAIQSRFRRTLTRSSIDVRTTSSDTASGQSVAMETSSIAPAVIVGYGRVGQALEKMGGGHDTVVRRGQPIPVESQGPIILCTRNDALAAIIDSAPPARREDFVFVQNGMLEPFLESKGLADATIVLVYFAVAKAGDPPLDGKTDLNPEGLTAASGKWAQAIATRLQSAGLSCKVLDPDEFKKPLLEKLIWISAFMLVGARHPGATVGVVEKEHRDEAQPLHILVENFLKACMVSNVVGVVYYNHFLGLVPRDASNLVVTLIKELAAAAESEKKVKFDAGVEDRLLAYARSVAHFPTAVKEFEWRNGWFYSISQRALAGGQSDPLPLHTAWLKEVGAIKD